MEKNTRIRVSETTKHPNNRGRLGYFQFLGGPEKDCAVCTADPTTDGSDAGVYFAVGSDEVMAVSEPVSLNGLLG